MLEERTHTVENGLLPANTIKGTPRTTMNLVDRMKHYNVPGVSIAVINQADIEWARGYGVLEAESNVPVTPETLFQAASISKPVAAMAALSMVQTGKLDLDTDVNRLLRSWQVPENEYTQKHKVTLRGLLSHTAGLTVSGFDGYAAGDKIPTLRQILDGEPPANSEPIRVDLVPGTQHRYSGGGYTVMQQLLEDIACQPFAKLMQTTILDRLGMHNSTFEQPLPRHYTVRAATAHRGNGKPIDGKWHTYPEMAAAGLWTTPSDLACFAVEVLRSSAGQSNMVLAVEMVQEMLTPPIGEYGLGFGIKRGGGPIQFSHGGGNEGFRCFLVAHTNTGLGAVVMTNGDNGNGLMMEVVRSVANIYDWLGFQPKEKVIAQVDPSIYAQYEGVYRSVDFPDWGAVVTREDENLFMQLLPDSARHELYPESESKYFAIEKEQEITFVKCDVKDAYTLVIGSQWKMQRVE